MALIKIEGNAKFTGKTIFDGGPTPEDLVAQAAASYIAAVEAADGQSLEAGVSTAITNFVMGCYSDGIWSALKACCIMAGARTLNGALVPLVGTAPTNNNFVSGDYNRYTGLKGNGTTKYLDSNRAANSDPQNNAHASVYVSERSSLTGSAILGNTNNTAGSTNFGLNTGTNTFFRCQSSGYILLNGNALGFLSVSRNNNSNFQIVFNSAAATANIASQASPAKTTELFAVNGGTAKSNARLSFYSIGESLDLALLSTRVSALMTAINAAI